MALTISQVESRLSDFFIAVQNRIAEEVANNSLPLIDKLSALPGAADILDPFSLIKSQILNAIGPLDDGGTPENPAAAIVQAINALNIPGITASEPTPGELAIVLATDRTITTGTASLDIGKAAGGFLDLDVDTAATVRAALAATLSFAADGSVSLKDNGTPELTVAVDAALSLGDLDANLGIAKIRINDASPAKPELSADFAFDLSLDAGGAVAATTSVVAEAGLDLMFATSDVLDGVLPDIAGRIVLDVPVSGTTFGAPIVALKDITLDLRSYLDIFGDTLGEVGDVFNNGALGTIVDIALEPVPGLNSLVRKFPFLLGRFDQVGGINGDGDGNVTLGDLAVFGNKDLKAPLTRFYQGLAIIDELRKLNLSGVGGGLIRIGDATVSGGVGTPVFDKNAIIAAVKSAFGDVAGLSDLAEDFLKSFDIEGLPKPDEKPGLTLALIENPARILDILLGTAPVSLIEYNVPALELKATAGGFFNVLGPLGFELSGNIRGVVDLDVGYDTFGLASGDFYKGFYFTTQPLAPGQPGRFPYKPVGELDTYIDGGAGLGFAGAFVTVGGSLDFKVDAYFKNTLFRPLADDFGCAFDVSGRSTAEVGVKIEIGFGPFKVKKRIPLVSTVLADFNAFTCPPATVELPPETPGLATVIGTEAILNVGDRANLRQIPDNVGGTQRLLVDPDNPDDEAYVIGLARNRVGNSANPATDPPPQVVPGIDIFAFGVTQRVAPPTLIKADFGAGNDSLIVQSDVSVAVVATGGAGEDVLTGGSGNDVLSGDGEDDVLSGAGGNDILRGGDGDDVLDGGKGADTLEGGDGIDTVTYSEANRDLRVGVFVTLADTAYKGSGGEADGDTFDSIEVVTGTDYEDYIRATGADFAVVLEGGEGSDVLIGGKGDDLLFGSQGGDLINGQEGFDGTTYISSWGQVDVDLQRALQFRGDANGDRLFNLEAIQGSINPDVILGNGSDNRIDGADGDDILQGRGGADTVTGNGGNDLVLGGNDGDVLDGGSGYDTLNYQNVAGPVTVDLASGTTGPGTAGNSDQVVLAIANVNGSGRGYSSFEALIGSEAGDSLTGDLGDNRIEGRGGADVINGDAGNDVLEGGGGADLLIGGAGIDWVVYDRSGGAVMVDLLGVGSGGTAQGDTYTTVENVLGSSFADRMVGNGADNLIDPNISSTIANEVVDGRGGTDILRVDYSSSAADFGDGITGGFDLFSSTGGSLMRLTAGLDRVTFTDVERLFVTGTSKADTLYGGQSLLGDRFYTGGGDDVVFAGIGADDVRTGSGDDTVVYGTTSGRQLSGSTPPAGDTTFVLSGGSGIDTLSVSLAASSDAITLVGAAADAEFNGPNARLSNGASISDFEILRDVWTGFGNDVIRQGGAVDNRINAGWGEDTIAPGFGTDLISGGFDFTSSQVDLYPITGGFGASVTRLGFAPVQASDGDLLELDYSSLTGSGIYGSVRLALSSLQLTDGDSIYDLYTNSGAYTDSLAPSTLGRGLSFDEIERLTVKGTQQADLLIGTYDGLNQTGSVGSSSQSQRGDDLLEGLGGDDVLIGNSGEDTLLGGDGDDILVGWDPAITSRLDLRFPAEALVESGDTLTGGAGADTFWLGSRDGYFYSSFSPTEEVPGQSNRALITDFNPVQGDRIQLHGSAASYRTVERSGSTFIIAILPPFSFDGGSQPNEQVIGEIQSFTGFNLNAAYVSYVDSTSPITPLLPVTVDPAARTASLSPDTTADAIPDAIADATADFIAARASAGGFTIDVSNDVDALAAALGPVAGTQGRWARAAATLAPAAADEWVTQTNDLSALKAILDGATGASGSSLTVEGSAEAIGTFEGDPFGLGKGLILSTGRVKDLPGANTISSSGSNITSIPIGFEKIGRTGNTDIFRADLSNLGIDLRSLTLTDGNTKIGGSGGIASGFDLDAIALSRKFLPAVTDGTDLNLFTTLEPLGGFDFSNASITFRPGTQRPPTNSAFLYGETLLGAANGQLVDNSNATLQSFDYFESGLLTLGDGGSISFDLISPVKTDGPLYLYIGEAGGIGETVVGSINVSPDSVEPTGDLSTDLGAPGTEGDTTLLTYSFSPKVGDTSFALDVVLFSEELPEFDGTRLTDLYSIKLNGLDIGALSNDAALTIKNLVYSDAGDLIDNTPGTGPLADGIRADAYTRTLTIGGALQQGIENVLTIEVKDGRDGFLDSGLLIKDGSFRTFSVPTVTVTKAGDGTIVAGGNPVALTVAIDPPTSSLTTPVTVTIAPSANLDLGLGVGEPVTVTFSPEETTLSKTLTIMAPPGVDPGIEGIVRYAVNSSDTAINGQPIPPDVLDIVAIPNQAPISLSITNVSKPEGNSGTTAFVFDVTLNNAVDAPFRVDYSTEDGSTTLANNDYLAASGTLNFTGTAGETRQITVNVVGDTTVESNENFFVNLSNLQASGGNVSLASTQATGSIQNDDSLAAIAGTRNRDVLAGTPGDDVITGLQGPDLLTGNGGADCFVYTSIVDGGDTITDFNPGQGDRVDLTGALRSVGYTGTNPIPDGYIKFVASGSNSILQIDPDGLGLATPKSFILFQAIDIGTLSNPGNFICLDVG